MKRSKFQDGVTVYEVTLPSGRKAWRVEGKVKQARYQKQFRTKLEADVDADQINARYSNALPSLPTRLTPDQLASAETAFRLLPDYGDLVTAVEYYKQHFIPFTNHDAREARNEFIWSKRDKGISSGRIDNLGYELDATFEQFKIKETEQLLTAKLEKRICSTEVGDHTRIYRYATISQFCDWLVSKHWLPKNPCAEIEKPKEDKNKPPPAILTLEQCQNLLQLAWTDPWGTEMLPYFAMCLLSGVRPNEMMRARENHFFLDEGHNIFHVHHDNKTGWRTVELLEPLVSILNNCRNRGLNLCYWRKRRFVRIRKDAGVFDSWASDVLRHSFASYHYAVHRDIKWLTKNMGNSEAVLNRRYINTTVSPRQGEAFFKLAVDFTQPTRPKPIEVEV